MRYVNLLLLLPLLAVLGCPESNKSKDKPPVNVGRDSKPPSKDDAPKPPGKDDAPKPAAKDGAPKPADVDPAIVLQKPAAGTLALTPDNTKIEFTGTKPGGKHDGGFKKFSGGVELTGDEVSKVTVEIDTNSLWSDAEPKLTGHLKSPDFFDVKTHPKAAFVSTVIKKEAGKGTTHVITGTLTLLAETKPIVVPAKIEASKDTVSIDCEFKINRSEFGMTYGKGKVDDPVTIRVSSRVPRK
jgi:polyisoprenoid-binding protein YceI